MHARSWHACGWPCCPRTPRVLAKQVVGVGGQASSLVGQLWDNKAFSHLDMLIINTDVQASRCSGVS